MQRSGFASGRGGDQASKSLHLGAETMRPANRVWRERQAASARDRRADEVERLADLGGADVIVGDGPSQRLQ